MSLRTFTILAATICTSCGSAGLIVRNVPLVEVSEKSASYKSGPPTTQEEKSTAEEISVADMECPPVDVAGSNLASNLGAGCSKASRRPVTAAVVAARPSNPTDHDTPANSPAPGDTLPAIQAPAAPPKGGDSPLKPPANGPTGTLSPSKPPEVEPVHCEAKPVDEAAEASTNDQEQECETPPAPQLPSLVKLPINKTEQVVLSPALLTPVGVKPSRGVLTPPSADTNQ